MRVIFLHADELEFLPVRPAKGVKPEDNPSPGKISEAIVAFIGVEPEDLKDVKASAQALIEEIEKLSENLKTKNVALYPRVHATDNPAPASEADKIISILKEAEEGLKSKGYHVIRAPFGRYKAFRIKVKGHPLAELSRKISPKREKGEKKRERFYVALPDGRVYEIRGKEDYERLIKEVPEVANDKDLRRLIEKEALDIPLPEIEESEIVKHLAKFGFEREPMSDVGHMRYEPEAALIVDLVSEYSRYVANKLGIPVFYVKGTNMFSLEHPPIRKHAELFGERMYLLEMDRKKLVLRYAACFQQFAIAKDRVISYKQVPFGMLEVADSYRYEQKGEVVLSFRVRKFRMPDLHVFTKDLKEAVEVSHKIQDVIHEEASLLGRRYVAMYNVTDDFRRDHKDVILEFVKHDGRPALIHEIPRGARYRVMNVEYHIIDKHGRPREIATFQIDVGNAERFGIEYVDENGERKPLVIIHTALLGSIERYVYMVFDSAIQKDYTLPLRLSPIQVRVIPVSMDFLEEAERIAREIEKNGIRVELDDREESLGKKVRDAGIMWVPYVVFVGRKEVEKGVVHVKTRDGSERDMKLEELIEEIKRKTQGYPYIPRRRPMRLSMKPVYGKKYRRF